MATTGSGDPANDSTTTDGRIIQATLALIGDQGLGAVTMSRVADTAGVARQTLYNHYDDINSIVAAAIDRHNRESIEILEAALQVADSPTGKIEQMVRHFVMVGSHAQHALDFGSGFSTDVRVALETYKNLVEQLIHYVLEDGRRRGDFRADVNPEIDTILIRSLLDGLYELAADTPEEGPRIARTGTRTILAALH